MTLLIFSGNSNPQLANRITENLGTELGRATIGRFSDGEVRVEIHDNVRGRDVFILQSSCFPTNDNLMELLIVADAMRRASARRITAVMPYFGYARQDRRSRSARVPISSKLVADMLTAAGFDRLLTVDLHAEQVQGFFNFPVDNLYTTQIMAQDIAGICGQPPIVVSPDVGGVVRARALTQELHGADLAIIDKRRTAVNKTDVMHLIGEVQGRFALLVDDIVDTAGTLCKAAAMLKDSGASRVLAYATHPVLSGQAIDNINRSQLDQLVVMDTIPLSEAARQCARIRQISLGKLLAEAIRRVSGGQSLSAMPKSKILPLFSESSSCSAASLFPASEKVL